MKHAPDIHTTLMPPEAPMPMPVQDLRQAMHDPNAPGWRNGVQGGLIRLMTFVPAIATTFGLLWFFSDWLAIGGMNPVEWVLIVLVGMTFFWISFSVSTATMGLLGHWGLITPKGAQPAQLGPMDVALLVPVYNENPTDVFANALAMCNAVTGADHRFSLYILSDTRDDAIAAQEARAIQILRAQLPGDVAAFYRRRAHNTDKKSGNLHDWITRWGGHHDAMVVLDADSLMAGEAVIALADEMARDPAAGLIQTQPQLYDGRTLYARIQQFAGVSYGALLARGLALWSRHESNFWGHNAIIRTRAFADTAGLPKLRSWRGADRLILSHDFVEAALLRRAGWAVRFLPHIQGSYEEAPPSLIDFSLRDRRWCQGNMQHLRLLGAKGLHPVSRFHLFHGAISYLLSPAWFVLLTIWALLGNGQGASVITYFSPDNPLYPDWPEMSTTSSLLILCFMYAMLMVPKTLGALTVWTTTRSASGYGGRLRFAVSFVTEVLGSILFAPIMMIQQSLAVLRSALGIRDRWVPQQRKGAGHSLGVVLRFHALETLVGSMLVAGMLAGVVSLWLLPIAVSLMGAVPLSLLSGVNVPTGAKGWRLLQVPDETTVPHIITQAANHRALFDETTPTPDAPVPDYPELVAAE